MDSPAGKAWGLARLFPKRLDTQPCGSRVPGTCSTIVLPGDGASATVRFVESWYGKRRRLSHTYELVVSTRGLGGDPVVESKSYGDFPPQMVR